MRISGARFSRIRILKGTGGLRQDIRRYGCDSAASVSRHGPLGLPIGLPLGDGLTLVVQLSTTGQRHLHLGVTALEVQPQRDQGQTLQVHSFHAATNLGPVQQQFFGAVRVVTHALAAH